MVTIGVETRLSITPAGRRFQIEPSRVPQVLNRRVFNLLDQFFQRGIGSRQRH